MNMYTNDAFVVAKYPLPCQVKALTRINIPDEVVDGFDSNKYNNQVNTFIQCFSTFLSPTIE